MSGRPTELIIDRQCGLKFGCLSHEAWPSIFAASKYSLSQARQGLFTLIVTALLVTVMGRQTSPSSDA